MANSVIREIREEMDRTDELLGARDNVRTAMTDIRGYLEDGKLIYSDPNNDGNIVITRSEPE